MILKLKLLSNPWDTTHHSLSIEKPFHSSRPEMATKFYSRLVISDNDWLTMTTFTLMTLATLLIFIHHASWEFSTRIISKCVNVVFFWIAINVMIILTRITFFESKRTKHLSLLETIFIFVAKNVDSNRQLSQDREHSISYEMSACLH